jgi:hypothetical protein
MNTHGRLSLAETRAAALRAALDEEAVTLMAEAVKALEGRADGPRLSVEQSRALLAAAGGAQGIRKAAAALRREPENREAEAVFESALNTCLAFVVSERAGRL